MQSTNEYDTFRNPTAEQGTITAANRFRFSTKYWDSDTKTLAYQLRDYAPGMGRWLSRDPIEEEAGLNLYGYAANEPIGQIDLYGLWSSGDHENQTRQAWTAIKMLSDMEPYRGDLANVLVEQNNRVDIDWMANNAWHFNRGLKEEVAEAIKAYTSLLTGKEKDIDTYLAHANEKGCRFALNTMGNLTHAYQDYYAHAIDRRSDGSAATIGRISGTPGSPDANMKPASWGSMLKRGEHGPNLPEVTIEPGDRAPDAGRRKGLSSAYTQRQLRPFADKWWATCKCYAKQMFGH